MAPFHKKVVELFPHRYYLLSLESRHLNARGCVCPRHRFLRIPEPSLATAAANTRPSLFCLNEPQKLSAKPFIPPHYSSEEGKRGKEIHFTVGVLVTGKRISRISDGAVFFWMNLGRSARSNQEGSNLWQEVSCKHSCLIGNSTAGTRTGEFNHLTWWEGRLPGWLVRKEKLLYLTFDVWILVMEMHFEYRYCLIDFLVWNYQSCQSVESFYFLLGLL